MNKKVVVAVTDDMLKLPGSWLDVTWEFAEHAMGILDKSFYYSTHEKITEEFEYFSSSIITRLWLPEDSKILESLIRLKGECLVNLSEVDTSILDQKLANLYECFHLFIEAAFYSSVYAYDINALEREFLLWNYMEPQRKNVMWFFVSLLKRADLRKQNGVTIVIHWVD